MSRNLFARIFPGPAVCGKWQVEALAWEVDGEIVQGDAGDSTRAGGGAIVYVYRSFLQVAGLGASLRSLGLSGLYLRGWRSDDAGRLVAIASTDPQAERAEMPPAGCTPVRCQVFPKASGAGPAVEMAAGVANAGGGAGAVAEDEQRGRHPSSQDAAQGGGAMQAGPSSRPVASGPQLQGCKVRALSDNAQPLISKGTFKRLFAGAEQHEMVRVKEMTWEVDMQMVQGSSGSEAAVSHDVTVYSRNGACMVSGMRAAGRALGLSGLYLRGWRSDDAGRLVAIASTDPQAERAEMPPAGCTPVAYTVLTSAAKGASQDSADEEAAAPVEARCGEEAAAERGAGQPIHQQLCRRVSVRAPRLQHIPPDPHQPCTLHMSRETHDALFRGVTQVERMVVEAAAVEMDGEVVQSFSAALGARVRVVPLPGQAGYAVKGLTRQVRDLYNTGTHEALPGLYLRGWRSDAAGRLVAVLTSDPRVGPAAAPPSDCTPVALAAAPQTGTGSAEHMEAAAGDVHGQRVGAAAAQLGVHAGPALAAAASALAGSAGAATAPAGATPLPSLRAPVQALVTSAAAEAVHGTADTTGAAEEGTGSGTAHAGAAVGAATGAGAGDRLAAGERSAGGGGGHGEYGLSEGPNPLSAGADASTTQDRAGRAGLHREPVPAAAATAAAADTGGPSTVTAGVGGAAAVREPAAPAPDDAAAAGPGTSARPPHGGHDAAAAAADWPATQRALSAATEQLLAKVVRYGIGVGGGSGAAGPRCGAADRDTGAFLELYAIMDEVFALATSAPAAGPGAGDLRGRAAAALLAWHAPLLAAADRAELCGWCRMLLARARFTLGELRQAA